MTLNICEGVPLFLLSNNGAIDSFIIHKCSLSLPLSLSLSLSFSSNLLVSSFSLPAREHGTQSNEQFVLFYVLTITLAKQDLDLHIILDYL